MELDEIRSVWSTQEEQTPYQLDEQALHQRVVARTDRALHITNISELLVIGIYICAGIFLAVINTTGRKVSLFMYVMAAWMVVVALLTLISRIRRMRGNARFDRSVQGELKHGLDVTRYQVRLSRLMRWNTAPLFCLMLFATWENGKPWWVTVLILALFGVSWSASGWEHNKYKMQRQKMEELSSSLNKESE